MERTLVCVIGQTRAHALTWASFKRNVLDALGADLALAIGIDAAYDYANPFWQHARYRWPAIEHDDYAVAYDRLQADLCGPVERPDWRQLLTVRSHWLGGIKGANRQGGAAAINIFLRWHLLQNLRRDGALDHYDRIVMTRSDFRWLSPHPPLDILDPGSLWVPDGEHYGGIVDRHLVFTPDVAEKALGMIEPILRRPSALKAEMDWDRTWNIERYTAFHMDREGLTSRFRTFPYVMFTVRGEADSTSWSLGQFDPKVGAFVKYPVEFEAARRFSQLFASEADWRTAARHDPELFPRFPVEELYFRKNKPQPAPIYGLGRRLVSADGRAVLMDPATRTMHTGTPTPQSDIVRFDVAGAKAFLTTLEETVARVALHKDPERGAVVFDVAPAGEAAPEGCVVLRLGPGHLTVQETGRVEFRAGTAGPESWFRLV